MIIGVVGFQRSGKTEVARVFADAGYEPINFADPVREMALALNPLVSGVGARLATVVNEFGWEYVKDNFPEARRFLQRLGTEACRGVLGDDVWVDAWLRRAHSRPVYNAAKLEDDLNWYPNIVAADVRFPNEAQAIRDLDGYIIRVIRPGTSSDGHVSESFVDDMRSDYIITNTGTLKELRWTVEAIAYAITQKELQTA